MKNYFLILTSLLCSNSYTQQVVIGDDINLGEVSNYYDMAVSNGGEVYVASDDDNYLIVRRFDGVSWQNIANSGAYVDSSVLNCKLVYNSATDSLVLGYIKADGFYVRKFKNTWSNQVYEPCTPFQGDGDGGMKGDVRVSDNTFYFLFGNNSIPLQTYLVEYNSSTDFVDVVPGPSTLVPQLYYYDFVVNDIDGFPYFCFVEDEPRVERYNGLGWSDLDDNITDQSGANVHGMKMLDVPGTNELIVAVTTGVSSNNYRAVHKYDCSSNSMTPLLPLEPCTLNEIVGGGAFHNDFFYLNFNSDSYVGPNNLHNYAYDLDSQWASDFHFDQVGNMYWLFIWGAKVDVYKSGSFVLGSNEIENADQPQVYPNPATNQIQISSEESNSISFYSIDGALIKADLKVSKSQPLNIDFLSKGLYVVMLENPEGVVSQQRIVVE